MELVQLGTGKGAAGQSDQAGPEPARRQRAENAVAQLQLGGRLPGAGQLDDHRGRESQVRRQADTAAVRERPVPRGRQLCQPAQSQHVQGDPRPVAR